MVVMLLLGFSSGLPLALSSGTLQAWLADTDVDIKTIGLFTLVGLPYTLKFIWSPIMDRFVPPGMGRRRGWMLLTQFVLIIFIASMMLVTPEEHLFMMGVIGLSIAFCSASQDIAIDAYRTDVLHPKERGIGAGITVGGYRTGMLVSGAGALILADQIGWQTTYLVVSCLMLIGMLGTIIGEQPVYQAKPPATLESAVIDPFKEFMSRPGSWVLLLLIVLYKLGDAFAGTLTTAFLIKELQFTPTDVGIIIKGFGWVATISGAIYGGALMIRLGLFKALLGFGILQALTNLGFMLLAWYGKSYIGMVIVIGLENLSGGMGTAAFVALLMALCNHRYTATQFALLSALAALGRVFVGPPSGYLVDAIGWIVFFFITFLVALPGLLLLYKLRLLLSKYDEVKTD